MSLSKNETSHKIREEPVKMGAYDAPSNKRKRQDEDEDEEEEEAKLTNVSPSEKVKHEVEEGPEALWPPVPPEEEEAAMARATAPVERASRVPRPCYEPWLGRARSHPDRGSPRAGGCPDGNKQ